MADVAIPLEPSGAGIRRWIARNPDIPGVGEAYSDRLWKALGNRLYGHLRSREVHPIAAVLDLPKAQAIVDAWSLLADEVCVLEEMDQLGVPGATANAAVRLFGAAAAERFRADPYVLTLLESWEHTDAAALASGIRPDDPRRLRAAVDVASSRAFRTTDSLLGGHTAVTLEMLRPRVRQYLGTAAHLAEHAVQEAIASGALRKVRGELLQARAPWHMEREIEADVAARLARSAPSAADACVDAVIADLELEDGLQLEPEQVSAVRMAAASGFAIISGGAGTGKSTVCKAVSRVVGRLFPPRSRDGDRSEATCCMVAISGRAAQALSAATGMPAMTVHRYLAAREAGKLWFERGMLIVDEVSMVGTPDLWRILAVTPPAATVLLVGDVSQLPPIRAGYPAHALFDAASVPKRTLSAIHRQKAESGIPAVSTLIRAGAPAELEPFSFERPQRSGVFLLDCPAKEVLAGVTRVFGALAGPPVAFGDVDGLRRLHGSDIQVLCMTKAGPGGSGETGGLIERRWLAAWLPLHDWGLRVGSKLLWTKNSYDRPAVRADEAMPGAPTADIMNGSLGFVTSITQPAGATAVFDGGQEIELQEADIDRMTQGWAITVHKAQGSAFRCVILPLVASRMLDRTMLYTAITRARETVVIVGEPGTLSAAVIGEPRAWGRLQALDLDGFVARGSGVSFQEDAA